MCDDRLQKEPDSIICESEGQAEKSQKRKPPEKRPVVVRIFRALKRYEYRRRRRTKEYATQHPVYERMMAKWTRMVGLFTFALVVVGIVTAVIFWRQLNVMQGQLDEMHVEQRPWITINNLAVVAPLHYNPINKAIDIRLKFLLQNTGKSPARYVSVSPDVQADAQDVYNKLRISCEKDRLSKIYMGTVISPRQYSAQEFIISITKKQIDSAPGDPSHRYISPFIYGCVLYRFMFGNAVHETTFLINLMINKGAWIINPTERNIPDVPLAQIHLMVLPWGGDAE